MSGERTPISMHMDHIPRSPCPHSAIQLHDRIVHVLEEYMAEAGAIKGRDLLLEVHRIRCGTFNDRTVISCGWILRLRLSSCCGCYGHKCAHKFERSGGGGFALVPSQYGDGGSTNCA
jgi:hypothetical protein